MIRVGCVDACTSGYLNPTHMDDSAVGLRHPHGQFCRASNDSDIYVCTYVFCSGSNSFENYAKNVRQCGGSWGSVRRLWQRQATCAGWSSCTQRCAHAYCLASQHGHGTLQPGRGCGGTSCTWLRPSECGGAASSVPPRSPLGQLLLLQ